MINNLLYIKENNEHALHLYYHQPLQCATITAIQMAAAFPQIVYVVTFAIIKEILLPI
jgi:hypothetical protein